MTETISLYPQKGQLGAIIEYEPKGVPYFCDFPHLHKWRTIEKWYFKDYQHPDGLRPTTQLCERCGALRRLIVTRSKEGAIMYTEWKKLGYVLPMWREYDPYGEE